MSTPAVQSGSTPSFCSVAAKSQYRTLWLNSPALKYLSFAHDRLSGFDDEATLKQLFASLNDPSLILESGLADDLMVLPHVDLAVGITPMLDMDWKIVTLTFLPHQIENFNAVIDMMPSSDMVGLAPLSDYQPFIDALIKWGRYKNVRNLGTALALLADIALVELAEAAEAEEEDAKSVGSTAW